MERNYIAFISYRHLPRDMVIAKRLHLFIEKYTIPKALRKNGRKKLGIVFRDQEELAASSDLSADIQTALSHSEYLIVVCSPGSAESIWVNREIQFFLETHNRSHVLAVLSDGEPSNAFPAILTHVYDEISGSTIETEPLAVDVRPKHTYDSLRIVRKEGVRLIAAILGCSYDDLALREQKRTLQRTLSASVVSCVVVSCFLGMLWNKNLQIAEKNEALATEKVNVQYRESQLLTADAETAMAEGDYRTALRLAVEALPNDSSPDRPYYAPAESVLLEAMNVFGEKEWDSRMYDTAVVQMTPIADYCISDDGSRVTTIDDYGQMHCFDAADGTSLWSSYTQASGYYKASDTIRIMACMGKERIVSFFRGCLTCFDEGSGTQLWENDIGGCVDNCLFYNAEQDIFLCFIAQYNIDLDCTGIEFHAISGKTGQLLWRIPFVQSENLTKYVYSQRSDDHFAASGVFSEDGTVFFGAFTEWSEARHATVLKCYHVDMQNATAEFLHQEPLPDGDAEWNVTKVCLDEQAETVVIAASGENTAIVTCLNRNTGNIVWKQDLTPESDAAYLTYEKVFIMPWNSGIFVSCSDQLYYLDKDTGEILECVQLPGAVTWLDRTSNITVGFFLESGEYGLAWKNPDGLHTATIGIGTYKAAKNYGGGIFQLYEDKAIGEYEISVSNRVQEGYAAIVPVEDDTSILIKRPSVKIHVVQDNTVELPWGSGYHESIFLGAYYSDADGIIVGPFENEGTECYAKIDLHTNTVTQKYMVNREHYVGPPFFAVTDDLYVLHSVDGATELYSDRLETVLNTGANADNWYSGTCCASSYLAGTGEVITANLEANVLRIWINGKETDLVPLPKEQIPPDTGGDIVNAYVAVYPNGDILVSRYQTTVYHFTTGNWTVIQSSFSVPNPQAFTVSDSGAYMAFADCQDMLQIVDGLSGESVTSFALQMPYGAVCNMQFSWDDSVLIVKTVEGRIQIFDIATGKILFAGSLDDGHEEKLQVYQDKQNQRLYLCGQFSSSLNGVCIDVRTWTELSKVRNMIFFDTERGVLYRYESGKIIYNKIPDMADAIELANMYLQN